MIAFTQDVLAFHSSRTSLWCSVTKQRKQIMFSSSVWVFGPEFNSPPTKSALSAGERQTIKCTSSSDLGWQYTTCQEEASHLFGCWTSGNPSQVLAVIIVELFQIFPLSRISRMYTNMLHGQFNCSLQKNGSGLLEERHFRVIQQNLHFGWQQLCSLHSSTEYVLLVFSPDDTKRHYKKHIASWSTDLKELILCMSLILL